MSAEQLQSFLEAIQVDTTLQEQLSSAADLDAVLKIAWEAGYAITEAEVIEARANQKLELSDEELEEVSGGKTEWKRKDFWCSARAWIPSLPPPNPFPLRIR